MTSSVHPNAAVNPPGERAAQLAATFRKLGAQISECLRAALGQEPPARLELAAADLLAGSRWQRAREAMEEMLGKDALGMQLAAQLRLAGATLAAWPPLANAATRTALELASGRLLAEPGRAGADELLISGGGMVALLCLRDSGHDAEISKALIQALSPLGAGDQLLVAALVERLVATGQGSFSGAGKEAARRALLLQVTRGPLRQVLREADVVPHWSQPELEILLSARRCGMLDEIVSALADPAAELGAESAPNLTQFLRQLVKIEAARTELAPAVSDVALWIRKVAAQHLREPASVLRQLEQQSGLRGLSSEATPEKKPEGKKDERTS